MTEHPKPLGRDDLTPPLKRTGLPAGIRRNREEQRRRDAADRARFESAVDAHIAAHRMALDFLMETHQWIADEYDFDLAGRTRQAAIWALSGRCLGVARVMLDALALGYTAEVLHLARAEHEASRLAEIFGEEEGTDLLRRWGWTMMAATTGSGRGRSGRQMMHSRGGSPRP